MLKKKVPLRYRMLHWFTYHPWLKVISLILAIIVWFYVRDEINQFNPPSRNSLPVKAGMDSERNSASARFSLSPKQREKIPRL